MTGSDTPPDEVNLDVLFEEARAGKPVPSEALMARIAADANAEQPEPRIIATRHESPWRQLLDVLGGWPTLGGLVTATAAGVYIGIAQPDILNVAATAVEETEFLSTELWPGDAMFFEEG